MRTARKMRRKAYPCSSSSSSSCSFPPFCVRAFLVRRNLHNFIPWKYFLAITSSLKTIIKSGRQPASWRQYSDLFLKKNSISRKARLWFQRICGNIKFWIKRKYKLSLVQNQIPKFSIILTAYMLDHPWKLWTGNNTWSFVSFKDPKRKKMPETRGMFETSNEWKTGFI